jgi:cytochrome b561
MDQASSRYGAPAQALHWVMAVVVLIAFIYGPGGSETRVYSAARDFDRQLHETLGLSVLALVAIRLAWRMFGGPLPDTPKVARWMDLSATLVQALLYILLFLVPLTAIAGAWLEGHPLTLLAGVRIDPWVTEHHALGAAIAEVHTWLGDTIMWLAGLHALAGLFHHFVLKDDVLRSMLPQWLVRSEGN